LTSYGTGWLEQLLARYNGLGPTALGERRRWNGRAASVLKPELLERLRLRLRPPPPDGGLWSGPKVALWLAAELGRQRLAPQPGWEALRAIGHHRFEWLYVTACVSPATGETFWYLANGVSKAFFEELLALFAREAGAGQTRFIVLTIDGAGWHTEPNLDVPDGLRIVYLPRYSPQLQPAECLWPVLDEPIANQYFETLDQLDAAIAARCLTLDAAPELCHGRTNFHWRPKPHKPN
jgi:transposase